VAFEEHMKVSNDIYEDLIVGKGRFFFFFFRFLQLYIHILYRAKRKKNIFLIRRFMQESQ
jgi:hypothetical protein